MRIISSFSDFYDSLQDYQDANVWIREPKHVSESDREFKSIKSKLSLTNFIHTLGDVKTWRVPVILGYCGEYIKFFADTKLTKPNDDFQGLIDGKNKLQLYTPTKETEPKKYFNTPFYEEDVSFLKQYNLFVRYNTPIFLIHVFAIRGNRDFLVYTNPSFVKFGLTNFKEINQIYQDLDMFVSGVLSNNPSYPEVPDKHRQGSRFDKYSFRKLPETVKKF